MQLSYLFLLSLVVLVSANRLPNSRSTSTIKCSATITAKFDDLPTGPPAPVPIDIGAYRGLKYSGLNVLTLGVLGTPPPAGLMAASRLNTAAFGQFETLSTPTVTVVGGGAGYKTFNPTGIAYGCLVGTVESAVNVPASCTIAFSGHKAGALVMRQLATYEVAPGELTKAMSVASLQGFRGVDTVKFELVVPTKLTVAVAFDDFEYTGCT